MTEEPCPGVAAAIAVEVAIGAQKGLLHDVLRGVGIPAEKAGEIVGGIEMRHDRPVEAAGGLLGQRLTRRRVHTCLPGLGPCREQDDRPVQRHRPFAGSKQDIACKGTGQQAAHRRDPRPRVEENG